MASQIWWQPDPEQAARSTIAAFARAVAREYGVAVDDYDALWHWSVAALDEFWLSVWRFFDVPADSTPRQALASAQLPGASWFPGVRLNFVGTVFRGRDRDAVAVVAASEDGRGSELSWGELERRVAATAAQLRELGVRRGDRVVGYLPNCTAALVGFLATASLGAIWSCCGPDLAPSAAANRLAQLEPVVLLVADGYHFGGRRHDRRAQATELAGLLPTVTAVLYASHLGLAAPAFGVPSVNFDDVLDRPAQQLRIEPVPFEHPLWVLYSSGTTGIPKGLVHSHGGVVVDGCKTLGLHLDLTGQDRLFWYTTTNWMMWNFAAEALLVGASTLLYDGSPTHPGSDRLWRIAAEHAVTVLGVSPGYLQASERQGDTPAATHDLHRLRLIGVTGSPLPAGCYDWVRAQFGPRLPLMSTSGGTDVVSALAGWAPTVPIWRGEISCAPLGVALDCFDESGRSVRGQVGELVITAPMPTMPVFLWNDPDGSRYRETYFSSYPGVWRHGDWITITDHGSVIVHGRSDATLNRRGVRLGSADIYEIVERVPGVREALVVGVDLPDAGYWMPLFVVLEDGVPLDAVRDTIVERLRRDASPRHVPDEIIAVDAIPHTRTGKKLEVPVKRILAGMRTDDALSVGAVDDPAALGFFVDLAAASRSRRDQ